MCRVLGLWLKRVEDAGVESFLDNDDDSTSMKANACVDSRETGGGSLHTIV